MTAEHLNTHTEIDRRQGDDRRFAKNHPLTLKSLRGKRQHGRRQNDLLGSYVDRYDPILRFVCLGIVILSSVDAFFTLRILELGGMEVNPVMKYLIEWDHWAFVFVKLFITGSCIAILVAHTHFRWFKLFRVSYVLYLCFCFYVSLIGYEIFLLHQAYSALSL